MSIPNANNSSAAHPLGGLSMRFGVGISLMILAATFGVSAQTRLGAQPVSARRVVAAKPITLPAGVTSRPVRFFSEGVECAGDLFLPPGFSSEGKVPGVVLAPGWGETSIGLQPFAAQFAARGIAAMTIDYRGWGKSGGLVQTVETVRTDDRLRFSQMTAKVRIVRKRLVPQQQILDLRNALYFLQGEPGIERTRIGLWGTGLSGGHVLVAAATDARIKVVVAQAPQIDRSDLPRGATAPAGSALIAIQRNARLGPSAAGQSYASTTAADAFALTEYHPFWSVDQIPATTAVLLIVAEKDAAKRIETALASANLLKGPKEVITIPAVNADQLMRGQASEAAAKAAAAWFLKYL